MVVNLYTPGHGDPLDTLITNGIVISLIEEYPTIKIEILKQFSRSIIKISDINHINERSIIENAVTSVIDDCELGNDGKIGLSFRSQPAIRPEKISKTVSDALSYVDSTKTSFVKEFSEETHVIKWLEGRGKEKRNLFKAYIQIAPFTGSYLKLPYMTVGTTGKASKAGFKAEEADYVICPLCLIFSWAGLVKSASIITSSSRDGKKRSTLFLLPSPIKATQDDIALLGLIFGEKMEEIRAEGREIPPLGGILYSIVGGETIGALSQQSLFDVIYWICARDGNFISIKDFGTIPLLNIYEFITEAKRRSPFLVRMVNKIVEYEPELLGLLTESLVFRGHSTYNVVRALWSFLEKLKNDERIPLDLGIVNALIETIK